MPFSAFVSSLSVLPSLHLSSSASTRLNSSFLQCVRCPRHPLPVTLLASGCRQQGQLHPIKATHKDDHDQSVRQSPTVQPNQHAPNPTGGHQNNTYALPPALPSTQSGKSAAASLLPQLRRLLPILLTVAMTVFLRLAPAFAAPLYGPFASIRAMSDTSSSFVSGLTAAFVLVLASEIGDKTFFISALLSMKYSRVLVLIGTMFALSSMTVISVGIGQIFHALPSSLNTAIPFDDYAAVALLLWFGFQNIRDGLSMSASAEDELQDAKETLSSSSSSAAGTTNGDGIAASPAAPIGVRVVAETSSLIFLAEWGDKSMLATVALAAAKSPLGVIAGGISGHLVASIIAVVGGSFLGRFISERNARLIGGVLFFVFAILTVLGLY